LRMSLWSVQSRGAFFFEDVPLVQVIVTVGDLGLCWCFMQHLSGAN